MADDIAISSGTAPSGDLTMGDIARLAKVSKPTVSRALSDSPLVSAETRAHVISVAQAHGYVANRNAQRLRQTRTNAVAVVLDFDSHQTGAIGDPFIFELLAGVSEALSARQQDLLLSPAGLVDLASFRQLHRSRATDGFIVLGQGSRDPMLRQLARTNIPLVVWGAVEADAPYCAVGSDNLHGGRLAGRRFLAAGAKRWLFVGNVQHTEIALRFRGMKEIADVAGDVIIDELSLDSMAYSLTYSRAADYIASMPRPDAVFTFSDTAAMAVISAFREAGHLTPRDYALVGYNNIPPSEHFTPAITTIEQPTHLAGAILVEKLMQLMDGSKARPTTLPTRIIVRET
jgi:DNA-binding LacI/PurR family transcriptional regulator